MEDPATERQGALTSAADIAWFLCMAAVFVVGFAVLYASYSLAQRSRRRVARPAAGAAAELLLFFDRPAR